MSTSVFTKVFGSLFLMLSLAIPAQATLYNFGADIGGETVYADTSDYSGAAGMGWTFKTDAESPAVNYIYAYDKRSTYPTYDADKTTYVADLRDFSSEATEKDYFTWRIDLPNGQYSVTVMSGSPTGNSRADIVIGDIFNSTGNTGAIDADTATQLLLSDIIPTNTYVTGTKTYTVENGYLLLGVRRYVGYPAACVMNTLEITAVPEPATMFCLFAGGFIMLRKRL